MALSGVGTDFLRPYPEKGKKCNNKKTIKKKTISFLEDGKRGYSETIHIWHYVFSGGLDKNEYKKNFY